MRHLLIFVVGICLISHGIAAAEVDFNPGPVTTWPTTWYGTGGEGNGHYYRAVNVGIPAGETLTFEEAKQYAESLWFQGFQGYLWTPNTNNELDYVGGYPGYVGGKRNSQGVFEWVVGPEAGEPVSGVRWYESPRGYDCLIIAGHALIDVPCTGSVYPYVITNLVVEYGTAPRGLYQGPHITYFDDESEWAAAVTGAGGNVVSFNTQQYEFMPKADELSSPPGTNGPMGPQLTFRRENTGLPLDFRLKALNVDPQVPGRALVYSDGEGAFPIFASLIHIGDVDGVPGFPNSTALYQNDDFEVSVTNRRGRVFAIGLTVYGNLLGKGENLKVYDENGGLLEEITYGLPSGHPVFQQSPTPHEAVFMGVVSDVPISRIVFDERDDGNDLAVRDFRFGVGDLECITCTSCTSGLCEAVPDSFVWDRSEDWALGLDDPVNPALDQNGCPVWSYEWTQGEGLDSPTPWYLNPTMKMLWDDSWYAQGNGMWVSGDNLGPQGVQGAITHIVTGAHYPNIPVLRWKNCTEGVEEICVDGELVVDWNGTGGTVGSPIDVDLVVAHVGAEAGAITPLLSMTVSKPTNNEDREQLSIPVSLQTAVGPGDQILVSHRGRTSVLARWIRLVDNITITPCGDQIGSIAGRVVADCPEEGTGLYGVVVDVFEVGTGDLIGSDTTDVAGQFVFEELETGDYTLSMVTPLGYTNVSGEIPVIVAGGAVTNADFSLSCSGTSGEAKASGFWKHDVGVATGGKGKAHLDGATLCTYLDLIEAHFNSNAINQVIVYQPPASGECVDKLLVARDLLNLKGNVGMAARARQHLMSLLLNVAAGHVGLMDIASADSATVSQAITYCDMLLDDLDNKNDELAKNIAEQINNEQLVEANVIPTTIENIAYSPGAEPATTPHRFGLDGAYPNPFNPRTTIAYEVPASGVVKLNIYDVQGRLVRTVVHGEKPAGKHRAVWQGRDTNGSAVASGVYLVRLEFGSEVQTRKIVLLK